MRAFFAGVVATLLAIACGVFGVSRLGLFPIVLANSRQEGRLLPGLEWVKLDPALNGQRRVVTADVADPERPWRHDSAKVAAALIDLLAQPEAERPAAEPVS